MTLCPVLQVVLITLNSPKYSARWGEGFIHVLSLFLSCGRGLTDDVEWNGMPAGTDVKEMKTSHVRDDMVLLIDADLIRALHRRQWFIPVADMYQVAVPCIRHGQLVCDGAHAHRVHADHAMPSLESQR